MKRVTKPDFIIIGAMKSATSTLHSQLAMQDGIFMSTPKEPNYFSDDDQYIKGEQWYESLFAGAKQGDLCGESSTHYTKKPDHPATVSRMAKNLTSPKLIYVIRHPIDRLISHYIHQWSRNLIRGDINTAIGRHPELINYSKYAMQLKPFFDTFGINNILPVFTEKLKISPQEQLDIIANFIGYDGQVVWHQDLKKQNVSRERIRPFYGYDFLVRSRAMAVLRRTLIPQFVRNKVKEQLTMKESPVISDHQMQYLKEVFNNELNQLGKLMDVDLNCNNYKEKVINNNLGWSNAQQVF